MQFSRQQLEEVASNLFSTGFFEITELDNELLADVPSYTLKVTVGDTTRYFNWVVLKQTPASFTYLLKEFNKINPGALIISSDKQEYSANEQVKITIKNNSDKNVFFGGCNEYDLQRYDPTAEYAPDGWGYIEGKQCVWEGLPTKLTAGQSIERDLNITEGGTYRISISYADGCLDGKPLSQANCRSFSIGNSDEFIIGGSTANFECNTNADCAAGGCSSQVCTTKELAPSIITTCEYRSEYACLGLAGCGCIQNKCQWDKDKPAYQQCITELPSPNYPDSQQPQ